eukprot:GDKI01020198.1.p1 GENE.GDKI01020198.1~~GDKI01020198.1.p1  ORF type:complete len:495 (+),score=138.39 GDKI01020198.1:83-1567(+)
MSSKKKVAYLYDSDIGSYYYGPGHPMKPQRIRMTHSLVLAYELYRKMDTYRPHRAGDAEVARFHDWDYVGFLNKFTDKLIDEKDKNALWRNEQQPGKRFGVGEATDCPIFPGLYEFQQSCSGASIDAAALLNSGQADIAINWSGGLHHAKRSEASGFCYLNDIVLGILELLKYHARVMYIDIDIHHGDGVEEAFYITPRVLTVSFHKFGDFFPGTGDVTDVGAAAGKYYSLNVPLNDGMDDDSFLGLFEPIIEKCIEVYRPGAIVLQCGADSLTGDRLGRFNLSTQGHARCLTFCRKFNIPLMVLGGGGYTIRNVARCWAYETATALGEQNEMCPKIPINDYSDYFAPDHNLFLTPSDMPNSNSKKHLEELKQRCLENLRHLEHAPGVEFAFVPPDFYNDADWETLDEYAQQEVFLEGGGLAPGQLQHGTSSLIDATQPLVGGEQVPGAPSKFHSVSHAYNTDREQTYRPRAPRHTRRADQTGDWYDDEQTAPK